MKLRPIPPCLLLGALLYGCAPVGPDYVRPTVTTPAAFKETAGWKLAQPADNAPRGPWWRMFDDAELDALASQVAVNNQNVKAAEAGYRQAQALLAQTRAGLVPTVTGNASLNWSQQQSSSTANSISHVYSVSLGLDWEIDVWGRIRRAIESSESATQASAADLAAAQLAAQTTLVQSYLQICANDAQQRLYDDTVAAYQRALDITRNRYQAGVAQKSDVTLAETQLNTAKAQAADLTIQRAQLENAIAVLIGQPPALFALAPRRDLPAPPAVPPALPSSLLERRPDVAAAERRAAAANAQIGVATAALYPAIALNASGGFVSSALSSLLSASHRYWALGPTLSTTLFDGGALQAQETQAIARYDQSVAAYRQTVLTAFQEVEDNLAALVALRTELDAARAAERAAAETLRITQEQYKAGTVSYLNVAVVQNAYLSAQRSVLDGESRQLIATVNLVSALGGGWQGLPSEQAGPE